MNLSMDMPHKDRETIRGIDEGEIVLSMALGQSFGT